MKRYHLPDGRTLEHGNGFVLGDYRYPPNWLELATPDDLSVRSITTEDIVVPGPTLEQTHIELLRTVDADAERVRLKYITGGVGMSMTYAEKKDQAIAVLQMGEASANALVNHGAAEFPTLSASVPLEATSLYAAAQLVISKYEQWTALSRIIGTTRLTGKKAISDASDVAAARAAYEAIVWTV